MPTFPTLTEKPSVKAWKETVVSDPVIRSPFEAGYVQKRARYTRTPQKWHVAYEVLPTADKNTLKTFEQTTINFAGNFDWTNPMDNTVYDVTFMAPIVYKPNENDDYWSCEFDLAQE